MLSPTPDGGASRPGSLVSYRLRRTVNACELRGPALAPSTHAKVRFQALRSPSPRQNGPSDAEAKLFRLSLCAPSPAPAPPPTYPHSSRCKPALPHPPRCTPLRRPPPPRPLALLTQTVQQPHVPPPAQAGTPPPPALPRGDVLHHRYVRTYGCCTAAIVAATPQAARALQASERAQTHHCARTRSLGQQARAAEGQRDALPHPVGLPTPCPIATRMKRDGQHHVLFK